MADELVRHSSPLLDRSKYFHCRKLGLDFGSILFSQEVESPDGFDSPRLFVRLNGCCQRKSLGKSRISVRLLDFARHSCVFHLLEHDRLHLYFFLGAYIGLSFSSKYLRVLFLHLPIVGLFLTDDSSTNFSVRKRLGSLLTNSRSAARNLFVSYAGFSVVVFFCLAIFILRNFELFVEAYDTHSPWTANHGLFGTFPPPASVPSYLVNVCLTALGVPLYFCSLSGMVLAGFTRDRKILILLITVLPFWLFLEIIHYHQLRFSVTLLPFLCLLAAYFIDFLMKANLKYARALAGSALVLTLLYSATYTYAFIHVLEVERDPRFVITRWMEENAVDEETVAVLGHDITTNSLGFIRYDGMDRLSGRAYSKPGYPRFIFLPSGSSEILDQYLELTANGYTYSQEDWWPIAPPSEETIRLFENLSEKDNYEIVRVFRNKPQFNGIQFDTERLKFDTFRITDLEILVYERKLPGSRTDS